MNRSPFVAYPVALAAVVAAVVVRLLLDSQLGDRLPFVTLFLAVSIAAWYGGRGPALVALATGAFAVVFFILEPRYSFSVGLIEYQVGLILYSFVCVASIALFEALHKARKRAEDEIAGRRAAEKVLTERESFLRIALGSIGDGVITTDINGNITILNGVAQKLTGWTLTDAEGQPLVKVFQIFHEDTRQPVENPALRALREGTVFGLSNQTVLIARDGTERAIDDSAAPIRDDAGTISGAVLVFRDISEQRRLEKENASRFRAARLLASIVESSDDAIISKSLDGVIQSWNAAAERLFGYPAELAVGRHVSFLIPADRIAEEDRIIASLRAGERIQHFETMRLRSDGQPVSVSLTISPVKDDTGRVIGASKIVRDITERKRVEADRQKFVTLVENSTDFIGMCDLEGVPFFVNRAGLQMVGLDDIEQVRRTPVRDFFFPEDQSRIMNEFFPSVLATGHGELDIRFRHFKTGQARWMAYKVLTIADAKGKPIALATVSQDVTERRRLEDDLRKLADDLSQADRRKNEFLATLAHELRNPLAPIRNALQILRLSPDRDAQEQSRCLMQRQLEQMVRLVDDLLDMSRISSGKLELRMEHMELSAAVDSAVETSRPVIDYMGHELNVTLPNQSIIVDADPIRLAQVFGNLLNNSSKYMNRGGQIWLTVDRQGSDVLVSVKDTGVGISADQLPRIFEMFSQVERSLERSQGGLGIGLTLVKRLVEMHGGRIEARSDGPGNGAEFVVRLPVVVGAVSAEAANDRNDSPVPKSSLRILIVDDNRDSADSLVMLLRIMGNDTRTAYDGQRGLEVAEEFRPDVILLDIGLPKLNGYEACRRIREQLWGKDIVLIAMTGWGQDDDRRRSQEAGFDHHMVKPVDPHGLMKLLSKLSEAVRLDGKSPEIHVTR